MAEETKRFSSKPIYVIPFGVDTDLFHPSDEKNFSEKEIVIGTIKALEKVYGIDTLIKAFKITVDNNKNINLNLIVGGGTLLHELNKLAEQPSISDKVTFVGRIDHKDVALGYYNQIDVFANLSRQESFGVSVLEAMACAKPVVVSSVGGCRNW